MKICFIGATGHTRFVLDGIKGDKDVHIEGIAPGSKEEKIDSFIKKLNDKGYNVKAFDNYKDMLDEIKPDIAVVASYFGYHGRVVLDCIDRHCNVFVEKPVATDMKELDDIRNAYETSDISLAAMMGIRYTPHFFTAWKAVQDGAVGKVRLMNAQKSYRLGNREEFYKSRKTYGGTIPWVGIHAIDWLYWFSGEKFKSVYATHSKSYNNNHGDLEISALCHFTFENEVMGSVNIDYLRPATAPTHDDDRIRIAGTEGVIEVREGKVYLINNAAQGIQELPLQSGGEIFTEFMAQVRGNGKCMVTAEDSFYVTEAALRARQSADEERVIKFE